ncbi:hypothetical protein [Rhizorhapis suberifaciens]|uniref:Putative transcriptional regulator n=1 Tax=Rhizorhapis suberifaciens TaxID=13656 RepID=A0A840HZA8_9SPHN|nr:hypothetical protein [Rhizorhapis suberifaciens]MBB4642746.1 putative transcriptional regulator [Rhizorhapis suberifaciens]
MSEENVAQKQRGHSVVYSFFNKWEAPLRSGKVHVFFRKRFPSKSPVRVYFYIGAPVMAVVGSAKISKIERVSADQALSLAPRGCISEDELAKYLADRDSVGAIHMEDFIFFDKPVQADEISSRMVFSPPQNFQNISAEDEEMLMEMGR